MGVYRIFSANVAIHTPEPHTPLKTASIGVKLAELPQQLRFYRPEVFPRRRSICPLPSINLQVKETLNKFCDAARHRLKVCAETLGHGHSSDSLVMNPTWIPDPRPLHNDCQTVVSRDTPSKIVKNSHVRTLRCFHAFFPRVTGSRYVRRGRKPWIVSSTPQNTWP
jgi:hypothetical protein